MTTARDLATIAGSAVVALLVLAVIAAGLLQASACDARGGLLVKDSIGRHVCLLVPPAKIVLMGEAP